MNGYGGSGISFYTKSSGVTKTLFKESTVTRNPTIMDHFVSTRAKRATFILVLTSFQLILDTTRDHKKPL